MTPDELRKKIDDLAKRTEVVNSKKSTLSGKLQAKKEELAQLIVEIKTAGFDPKTLREERDKVQAQLTDMISTYEADLVSVETALSSYDTKK
jgi:chromosome segregation ATPase